MPSYVPAKKNTAYTFYLGLISQATRPQFQVNPTLAVGDVKISTDGGTLNNIDTLPVVTPAGGRLVKVVVAASDMNGDNIAVQFVDAAGAEWDETLVTIQTATRQIDDLAYPTTTGRSMDVDANGGIEVGSFQASSITNIAFASSAIGGDIFALSAGSKVWDAGVRALTATVTVGTNNDKTGYVLGASSIAASTLAASAIDTNSFSLTAACTVWNPAVKAITANGDKTGYTVSTVSDKTGYTLATSSIAASTFAASAIDTNAFSLTAACTVWNPAVKAITANGDKTGYTVSTVQDKTGYALAASSIAASTLAASAIDSNSFGLTAACTVWNPGVKAITSLGASTITTSVFVDAAASRVADITLTGTTLVELSQGQPSATPTLAQSQMLSYMALRNSASTTSGCLMITNNAGTVIAKASLSDNASTFERTKMVTGP